jgi:tRNA threonylcarbamoyl adenosine modification protein YeaZ
MKLLAIETAYDVCGVALLDDTGLKGLEEEHAPRRHNEVLAPFVERLLTATGNQFEDLEGLAVSSGPGSYTGLRVGMSYAKGVAFATGLAIIPVPTLPSLLTGEEIGSPDWVATWSHGRNVYAMQRKGTDDWNEIQFLSWDDFTKSAQDQTVAGYLLDHLQSDSRLEIVETCPSAVKVGKFALERRLPPVADPAALIPNYHQEFQIRLSNHAHS